MRRRSGNRERVYAVLSEAGCGLSPEEIAARVGLSRHAVGEHLHRLWAEGRVSPVEAPQPHAGGRFRARTWKAGKGFPWQPSNHHHRLLDLLTVLGTSYTAEALAEALPFGPRKVTVMLHELSAAGLATRRLVASRSGPLRWTPMWNRSLESVFFVESAQAPGDADEMATRNRRPY